MTDTDRAERLSRELDAAFRNRADLYRLFYDTLATRLGTVEAEALMVEAVEQRGREVAASAFAGFGPNDARALGEAFLAVSPDGGRLYPTDVERDERSIAFKVHRCPLKDAWVEAGLDGEALATMCRIAGAFDRGLFEATGVRFANVTWVPGHGDGCCHIFLQDRDAGEGGGPAGRNQTRPEEAMNVRIAQEDLEKAACLALRRAVFIDEQGVAAALEIDGLDDESTHVLAASGGTPIGAARFRIVGDAVKIQRVCVSQDFRGHGVGAKIIGFIVEHARQNRLARFARLGAQTHALDFYRKLGFEVIGPEYLDAGIPHRDMQLAL